MRGLVFLSGFLVACSFDSAVPFGAEDNGEDPTIGERVDGGISPDAPPSQALYRQELSFDYTPGTDLEGFPVLVILDSSRIDYSLVQDQGQDLRFTDASGETSLPHEIEAWNEQGRSYIWVRVPLISAAGGDRFWMSYGDATAEDGQRPNDVWTQGFAGVWHMAENISGNQVAGHRDSTADNNHADHIGATQMEDSTSLGPAQSFDGIDDRVELMPSGLQIGATAITMSARVRPLGEPGDFPHVIGAGSGGRHWQIFWDSGGGWTNRYSIDGGYYENWTGTGSIGSWSSVSSVYDGSAVRLYVDGVEVATTGVPTDAQLDALTTPIYIGSNPVLTPREFQGDIDEVRMSGSARSPDWIYVQHLSNIDSLLGYGAREEL